MDTWRFTCALRYEYIAVSHIDIMRLATAHDDVPNGWSDVGKSENGPTLDFKHRMCISNIFKDDSVYVPNM